MFYRRKLPHWHPELTEETFLFVTWRLAGSIPRVRQAFSPNPKPVKALAGGRVCPTFFALDRESDKAAFGPTWLRDARIARIVAEILLYGERERDFYLLRAWVIMPNHVHLLLKPKRPLPVITR